MLDALPYVNTAGSVGLMTDIMSKGGVPENIAKEWMMSIAFISRPDENMMRAVAELLQKKPFDVNVAFSVTALTHTYCSAHSDCIQNESVGTILNHIENLIVSVYRWKPFNRESQDKVCKSMKKLWDGDKFGYFVDYSGAKVFREYRSGDR